MRRVIPRADATFSSLMFFDRARALAAGDAFGPLSGDEAADSMISGAVAAGAPPGPEAGASPEISSSASAMMAISVPILHGLPAGT